MKNLIIVILLTISSVSYAQKRDNGCLKANIIFVLDWSGSFDAVNLKPIEPMKKFINTFTLSDSRVKVGIVVFGTNSLIWCPLTSSEEVLNERIDSLGGLKDMSGTYLLKTFGDLSRMISEDKKKREESVINLIVVVSDGGFAYVLDTFWEADSFRQNNTDSPLIISTVFISAKSSVEDSMIRIADPGFHFKEEEFNLLLEKIRELNLCL